MHTKCESLSILQANMERVGKKWYVAMVCSILCKTCLWKSVFEMEKAALHFHWWLFGPIKDLLYHFNYIIINCITDQKVFKTFSMSKLIYLLFSYQSVSYAVMQISWKCQILLISLIAYAFDDISGCRQYTTSSSISTTLLFIVYILSKKEWIKIKQNIKCWNAFGNDWMLKCLWFGG